MAYSSAAQDTIPKVNGQDRPRYLSSFSGDRAAFIPQDLPASIALDYISS
jgi:hypothetical protein